LYKHADITYVGGGFERSGIHNTLEAAVYGKPVIFGPNYQKFNEAKELINNKAAFSINNGIELENVLNEIFGDKNKLMQTGENARKTVYNSRGATEKIINYIKENRLLTI
jgi:3-deoxy-D-manno-octulosonic-acid transferase